MANIDRYLAEIRSAIYGEEVRGSIISALEAQNNETESTTQNVTDKLEEINTAIQNADTATATANTAASNADSSGENAVKIAQDAADEAIRIATEGANNAETTANIAAENANTAAGLANASTEMQIASYDITYQTSSIGTSAPTGEWTHAIPTVADGNYLWTRILFTLNNGDEITAYSVAKNGGTSGSSGGGNLWYGTSETASDTADKTVQCDGFTLDTGTEIVVNFFYTNTASNATLNVAGTGAFPIYYKGTAVEPGLLQSETTYMFVFAGAHYDVVGILETEIDGIPTSTIDSWFE